MAFAAAAGPRKRVADSDFEFVKVPRDFATHKYRLTHGRLSLLILDWIIEETEGKKRAPGSPAPEYSREASAKFFGSLDCKEPGEKKESESAAKIALDDLIKRKVISVLTATQAAKLGLTSKSSQSRRFKVNWRTFPDLPTPVSGPFVKPEPELEEAEDVPVKPAAVVGIGSKRIQPGKSAKWKPFGEEGPSVQVQADAAGGSIEADVGCVESRDIVVMVKSQIQQDTQPQTPVGRGMEKDKPPQAEARAKGQPGSVPPARAAVAAPVREFFDLFAAHGKALNDRDFTRTERAWSQIPIAEIPLVLPWAKQMFRDKWTTEKFTPMPFNALADRGWSRQAKPRLNRAAEIMEEARRAGKL